MKRKSVMHFLFFIPINHRGELRMELYAGATLSGLGYMLQQERDSLKKSLPFEALPEQKPSMGDIYQSSYWNKVKKDEQQLAWDKWSASQKPLESGVVPRPAYADMFYSEVDAKDLSDNVTQSLTGKWMKNEEFKHNNMKPYFRGSVKQNTDVYANQSLMEKYTGRSDLFRSKQECATFSDVKTDIGNVNGMQVQTDFYADRLQMPKSQNNAFPIPQIHVGPGLNKGFTANPSGGFQQESTLDFIRPKTVNELRPGNKPKLVNEAPLQTTGKAQITNRGLADNLSKNRVDTYYEQTADQWLATTGAYSRGSERPVQVIKPTSRVTTHVEYEGIPTLKASQYGTGDEDDYGKASVCVYDTERQTTQVRTVISNATSVIKALTAPFTDLFRHTTKEYMIDSARTFGNMQAQIPSKATLYDPVDHVMRTTIKETTIHDSTIANLRGPDAVPVTNDQEAKTTNRQTLALVDTVRNVSSHTYKTVVYDPEVVSKTTHRQTLSDNPNPAGYVGEGAEKRVGAYVHIPVNLNNTQRQFTADNDYYGPGGAKGEFRPVSSEAEYNAEIDGTREYLNMESTRTPTTQGVKLPFSKEGVDMDIKKLMVDSMAPRDVHNPTRVYQPGPQRVEACDITKSVNSLPNAIENRLDPGILSNLKNNPYNISVNPILAN